MTLLLLSFSWQLWLAIAVVLVIIELFTSIIATFCLAIGCLVAGLVALCGLGMTWQLIFFTVGAVVAFMLIPPIARKYRLNRAQKRPEMLTNMDALIGRQALVVEAISATQKGRVKIDGDNWQAVADCDIPVGSHVKVTAYDSIVLTVVPQA